MAERVKLAIVGCGGMGRRHLTGLAELSRSDFMNLDLVAVCDLNRQNAEDLADEAQGLLGTRPRVFGDAAQMVREVEGLEAADCTTDTGSHHQAATMLLDLGLHTLCEKPLALTAGQAREMYERAEAAGVVHMVNYTYRWLPPFIHLRDLIAQGYVGRCFHCEFRCYAGYARDARYRWRYDRRRAHGALGDLGSHLIDLARWCVGDIARVSAHLATSVERHRPEGGAVDPANDAALLAVEFRDGTQGVIHASAVAYIAGGGQHQEVSLHGGGGALSVFAAIGETGRAEARGARVGEREMRPIPIPGELWGNVPPERPLDLLTKHSVGSRAFVDAILAGRPASPSFHDGLKAQEVIDAALASHEQGRWVAVGA